MAQLPNLSYGQSAPMSSAEFKSLARTSVSAEDASFLDLCSLNPFSASVEKQGEAPEFIRSWQDWEKTLRLNLARYRAPKVKRDVSNQWFAAEIPDYPADAAQAAKSAAALESPLDAEILLDEFRWKAIDNFQGIDYFGVNTVYAYLLKLLLLERRSAFRAEEGFAEYKTLYSSIVKSSDSGALPAEAKSPTGEPK
ncbi:MAG: DUF2764 domain-containing protein [Treponema sp.]|jgi:hypothetical protein|nr:DUF2764 domain-containing protein [Treponema sp.]